MTKKNSISSPAKASAVAVAALVMVLIIATIPARVQGVGQAIGASQTAGEMQWTAVVDKPEVSWFRVDFPTREVGYAVGGPFWEGNTQVYVAKTTDGGLTWTPIPVRDSGGNWTGTTPGLGCKDADTCWIVGYGGGSIWRTTDGATTWQRVIDHTGYCCSLFSVGWTGNGNTALIGTTGYWEGIATRSANVLRATDGINFYGVLTDKAPVVLWDFSCPAPGICYGAAKGRAYYSTNDGQSWATRYVPTEYTEQFYGVDCINTSTCWMVGKQKRILFTSNTGTNWQISNTSGVATNSNPFFWDVDMIDAQHGYAAGCADADAEGNCSNGLVARTTDGFNWVSVPSPTRAVIMDLHVVSMDEVILVDASGKIWRGTMPPTPTPTATDTPTPTSTPTATPSPTPSLGTISGIAFQDLNLDLLHSEDEPGLAGAVLMLKQGPFERYTTTSQADGTFAFADVAPGQYTLMEETPPDGFALNANAPSFRVQAGDDWTFYIPHQVYVPPTATPTPQPSCHCSFIPMILKQPAETPAAP